MTIDADSEIQDVLDTHNDFAPTATELEAWNAATIYEDGRPVTKIGLWGADLTDFTADCTTSTLCAAEDFTAWNGWAVGVDWAAEADLTAAEIDGVIIEDVMWGAEVTWAAVSNTIAAYDVTGTVAAGTPLDEACTAIDDDNQFGGWSGVNGTALKEQFMFAFLDEADEGQALLQADHEGSVWTTLEVGPAAAGANVNTAAFVFVGAVQLTVAATSAIALALLF